MFASSLRRSAQFAGSARLQLCKRPISASSPAGTFSSRQFCRLAVCAAQSRKPDVAAGRTKDTKQLARAFRAVPITVLTVSKGGSRAADDLAGEYADKIRRYTSFSAVELRTNPKKAGSSAVAIEMEGQKMLQALQPKDRVIALDERGRNLTSEDLSSLIAEAGDASAARLMFCIGGPYGHSQTVVDRADDVVRLSSMVLNHQVANIVLLEGIYRGLTILKGIKYHH